MSTDNDTYNPHETVVSMTSKNFVWALLGLATGLAVNKANSYSTTIVKNKYIGILLQLLLIAVVLAIIHVSVNNKFGWTWQNVTPGLYFVSVYFGVQFTTFTAIQSIV